MTITICDVAPRDGLQNDPTHLSPATRAQLVNRLVDAGLTHVEVTSFVNPTLVPQMAGAEEVVEGIDRRPGATNSGALVVGTSSRWTRTVSIRPSTSNGGATWSAPCFRVHGPNPSTSIRSVTATTRS